MAHQQTTPVINIPSAHCQTATQGVAKQLFAAMGIERDSKGKRRDWVLRGFHQVDAPVCVIITFPGAGHKQLFGLLSAKVVIVKSDSGFARQIHERHAKCYQRPNKQQRNAILVGRVIERTDEGNDDD